MNDLSHWDIVLLFSDMEAAALAVGLDPSSALTHEQRLRRDVVLRELNASSDLAVNIAGAIFSEIPRLPQTDFTRHLDSALSGQLISAQLKDAIDECLSNDAEFPLPHLFYEQMGPLTYDRFSLSAWFSDRRFRSRYPFTPDHTSTAEPVSVLDTTVGDQERRSLYKLVIGMAMDGYAYKPEGRSDATSVIAKGLQELGIGMDADTVRNWLKKAVAVLPPETQRR
jgi:hypothetical protein